jgi:hypothetical protein
VVGRRGRLAVLGFVVLALVFGAGEVSPQSVPASLANPGVIAGLSPAERAGSVFRNLDPKYQRASMWTRAYSVVTAGNWLISAPVAPLPLAKFDAEALRVNSSRPR